MVHDVPGVHVVGLGDLIASKDGVGLTTPFQNAVESQGNMQILYKIKFKVWKVGKKRAM